MRPSGRDFPLQPHFGVNRIANWSPSVTHHDHHRRHAASPRSAPCRTPTLATTNLAASMRRWRLTSAATVDAAAEQRSAGWVCWRGNAAGLGGWTFVTRLSLTTLQATGMGFFGLYGSTAALATTLTLAAVVNCIGIGFQRGTHTNWQLVHQRRHRRADADRPGREFPGGQRDQRADAVSSRHRRTAVGIGVRVVEEVTGAVFESGDHHRPARQRRSSCRPRNYMNNGATAAAVAYDCSGVYVETDY